ncbi:MAG: DUF1573 domain-containing protein [Bacteroidia bacterium]|jgi:hypothetical protein|nr:DUF1573 domain-containing protein [Bacteroidia bacterium]
MKKFLLPVVLFSGMLFTCSVQAQQATPADPNAPVFKFQSDTIDYGTIAHNADGYRYFKFTNVGKEPLIIKEARGSCGCTVPTPPKEPIQPGQESEIKVHYATDRIGRFSKTVTVISNANPGTKVLYIMGNVLPDAPKANTGGSTTVNPQPAGSAVKIAAPNSGK